MSVENTIVIPICTDLTLRGPVGQDTRFYSPESTWQLGPNLAGARIAVQCSHIEEEMQIIAGIDWSVDGRNWETDTAATASFFRSQTYAADGPNTALAHPGNFMSLEYRPGTSSPSKFGPYTRFWVGLVDYDTGTTPSPAGLSAMVTATVIARTI